jgi:spermidine/putrescine transport system ATP-binding protein
VIPAEFPRSEGKNGLRLSGIKKQFGNTEVLCGLDISIEQGEFVTLLGSSGCGKTTTIRIIAGLETADCGQVFIDGIDITSLAPDKRRVNMVFQNYALFPHMNVAQNIGYSLKLRGMSKNETEKTVFETLSLVGLCGFEKRKTDELSGGEKQRVALARAIINKPKALLLDEPLGALDLQLRRRMQLELKKLQKQLGVTFIYITHDQEEALTMSDRIAVMRNGIFEQIGTSSEIYSKPKTSYVASFVGGANILRGKVISVDDKGGGRINICLEHPAGTACVEISGTERESKNINTGSFALIAVREEFITFSANSEVPGLRATVTGKFFSGGLMRISARFSGQEQEITSCFQGIDSPLEAGDSIFAFWDASKAVLLESA